MDHNWNRLRFTNTKVTLWMLLSKLSSYTILSLHGVSGSDLKSWVERGMIWQLEVEFVRVTELRPSSSRDAAIGQLSSAS